MRKTGNRKTELGRTVETLGAALSAALYRLEQMQITHDRRMARHEVVAKTRNQAHRRPRDQDATTTKTQQPIAQKAQKRQSMSANPLENAMAKVARPAQEYPRAQLAWKSRQASREVEPQRAHKQMAEFQTSQTNLAPVARLEHHVPIDTA